MQVPRFTKKECRGFYPDSETLQNTVMTSKPELGCPSKTVVTREEAQDFWTDRIGWINFWIEIFSKCDMRISGKTRLRMDDPEEFEDLLTIYNKYPLEELIVHA